MLQVFRTELTVRVVHTDIPRLLSELIRSGIVMRQVRFMDELTAELTIPGVFCDQLQTIVRKRNAQTEVLHRKGLYWKGIALLKRPAFLIGVSCLLMLSVFLPSRILFVEVEGNVNLPKKQIMESAEAAGICFGAVRRDVRSEQVKNRLLELLPQLQWVGINTSGCTATISVSERTAKEELQETGYTSNIVAVRDGVISSLTVTGGNALCTVGQAVKAGEVLISPYTDCGLVIKAEKAGGEIFAETLRDIETVIPVPRVKKGKTTRIFRKYSLQIGKKRIKFYKDSGIYGTSCDKMYKEYCLTLPGGLTLPVELVVEQWSLRDSAPVSAVSTELSASAKSCTETYLLQQMIAGRILSSQIDFEQGDAVCRMTGQYRCLEMIGRVQNEEISADYE